MKGAISRKRATALQRTVGRLLEESYELAEHWRLPARRVMEKAILDCGIGRNLRKPIEQDRSVFWISILYVGSFCVRFVFVLCSHIASCM